MTSVVKILLINASRYVWCCDFYGFCPPELISEVEALR